MRLTVGAVPRQSRTRQVNAAQAGAYVSSLAIHAGINAADAVTGMRLGQRSAGQDHDDVLALLRTAGPDGLTAAMELARILPMKTRAEYEPDAIPKSDAARAVERARRVVEVARRIAAQSG
jgi:hypothetical protein